MKTLHVFNGMRTWNCVAILKGIQKAERFANFSIGRKFVYVADKKIAEVYRPICEDDSSIRIVVLPNCRFYRYLVALHVLMYSFYPICFHGHEIFSIVFSKLPWTRISFHNWGLGKMRIECDARKTRRQYWGIKKVYVNMSPEMDILRSKGLENVSVRPYFAGLDVQIDNMPQRKAIKGKVKVILGNNCHSVHDYIKMLDVLYPFREKISELSCVVGYGGVDGLQAAVSELKDKGRKLFGDVFQPLDKLLDSASYREYQKRFDVYIAPTVVQGGLNTIYAQIAFGSKVILNGINYEWLKRNGCTVYSCEELLNPSFSLNVDTIEIQEKNRRAVAGLINEFGPLDIWRREYAETDGEV